jgi:hypothetical protein
MQQSPVKVAAVLERNYVRRFQRGAFSVAFGVDGVA